ncbi:RNA polymerase subunit sigma [Niabella sp. 3A5MI-3]|nr:RNA polymerase subunit sigma [Niabella beijingensis]
MTAVLCLHFGLAHIEIAEDIPSDTFLKASEHWAIYGIPDNPTAWLYTVARNKIKDYFKHNSVFEKKIKRAISLNEVEVEKDLEFDQQIIADSQLAMIFAVCNSTNSIEAQISLALQILCGFSVEEIANAFLTNSGTIKKRLHRARVCLRNNNFQINYLTETEIKTRLDTVVKTLYLLFNEGYFSKTNSQLIRKELCSEAVRLTLVLTENKLTNTPQVNAMLALMYFQSSRLNARTSVNGEVILFDKQDRGLWDKSLIDKGNYYLINACNDEEISKYHLEAGIAYWHTVSENDKKWGCILQLYNQLLLIKYSSVAALNRAFAFSKVCGVEEAIKEVKKLRLPGSNYYHALLGYLYSNIDITFSIQHYTRAIDLTKSQIEKATLKQEIDRLIQRRKMEQR